MNGGDKLVNESFVELLALGERVFNNYGFALCFSSFNAVVSRKVLQGGSKFLLEQAALFHEFFGADVELIGVERFLQISIGTSFKSFYAVVVSGACRNHNHGNMVEQLRRANLLSHIKAVHLRHHDVGYDDVGNQLFSLSKTFYAIRCEVIAECRIHLTGNVFCHIGSVLNNQHACDV